MGDVMRQAIGVAIKLAGPMLILSMIAGVLIAIFQAVTQIHEQTIGFMLKLVVVVLVCVVGGGWMLTNLQEYTLYLFSLMRA